MVKKILFAILLVGLLGFKTTIVARAQEENKTWGAKVVKVIEEREIVVMEKKQWYQKLEIEIEQGPKKGEKVVIENGNLPLSQTAVYRENDRVMVEEGQGGDGAVSWQIMDFIRTDSLILLFIIFVVAAIWISGWRGASSLVSMGLSFLIIFKFVLPSISKGMDPVLIATLASAMIIPITFYMSHGISKKTTIAVAGTLIALLITGLLGKLFSELAHLNGLSTEESGMLAVLKGGEINLKGILLAGIVIGALGVLDDITISQAAIVEQLREAASKAKFGEIYGRAMKVGRDHITSMINTLILVYAGASLPLLLIFVDNPHPLREIINYEFIAEEIVRTLVGSIGLIVAVPITTFLAAMAYRKK